MLVVMMAMAAGNQIANVPFVGVSTTGIMEVNGPAGVREWPRLPTKCNTLCT